MLKKCLSHEPKTICSYLGIRTKFDSKFPKLVKYQYFERDQLYMKVKGVRVHPDLFMKLDFEIAVDKQIRARD